jgi:hypothetical protein
MPHQKRPSALATRGSTSALHILEGVVSAYCFLKGFAP